MPASCQKCGGRLRVESSKRAGDRQVRYVECQKCRERRRQVVPADSVWRRTR
jgi:ssDNA-binding Zn-finger/Zn-ribbon topoisomerase 1